MPFVKNSNYRDAAFSEETPHNDFHIYGDIKDLINKCELSKHEVVRCRTIGVLKSQYKDFYLHDLDSKGVHNEYKIQLSLIYLKSTIPSTVIPYPVQVFGTLEWKSKPVLYATLVQILPAPTAIRLKDIMSLIAKEHIANKKQLQDPP